MHFTGTRMPIKAIKMPNSEEYSDLPRPQRTLESDSLLELSESEARKVAERTHATAEASTSKPAGLKLLIAEDDPINMKILRKRFEKAGHEVFHAVNGEDCAAMYAERSGSYDAILMDMQVRKTLMTLSTPFTLY